MLHLVRPRPVRIVVLVLVFALVLVAVVGFQGNKAAAAAADRQSLARSELDAALAQARSQGYTEADLQPIPSREAQIEAQQPPLIPNLRASFYDNQVRQLDSLRTQLQSQEVTALDDARAAASSTLQLGRDLVSRDDQLGVDPDQLQPLETQLNSLDQTERKLALPAEFWQLKTRADDVNARARQLAAAQSALNAQLADQARQLEIQTQSRVDVLRHLVGQQLFDARNDASVASYLNISVIGGMYRQVEHYAGLLSSANVDQVALGAAGIRYYTPALHRAVIAHLPRKTIIVSLQAQELWAFQDGRLVLDSLVTTGRPQLPTDVGAMRILFKSAPWTMKSPWPKTSQWWYPDTKVQMAIFFTDTGESLHDAAWEPDGYYGPGSQYTGVASHGCIHVPLGNEEFLYGYTEIGTPVVVFPGDGSPVASQMAQITVDASGEPFTGPKGV